MNPYRYSVIRFVPSPAAGERVNLGLLVGSETRADWRLEIIQSTSRAAKLDNEGVLPGVFSQLQRLRMDLESFVDPDLFQQLDDTFEPSQLWLDELTREHRNVLQFTASRTVLADSADAAIELLRPHFLFEPQYPTRVGMSRGMVRAQSVAALKSVGFAPEHLSQRSNLKAGRSQSSIDIVLHNGKTQTIQQNFSFQLTNPRDAIDDVRSWAWTIRMLRDSGGVCSTPQGTFTTPADTDVAAIYAPVEDAEVMEEAKSIFDDHDVRAEAVAIDDVQPWAQQQAVRHEDLLKGGGPSMSLSS